MNNFVKEKYIKEHSNDSIETLDAIINRLNADCNNIYGQQIFKNDYEINRQKIKILQEIRLNKIKYKAKNLIVKLNDMYTIYGVHINIHGKCGFVGIDSSSGGYPWCSANSPQQELCFKDKQKAIDKLNSLQKYLINYQLVIVKISFTTDI